MTTSLKRTAQIITSLTAAGVTAAFGYPAVAAIGVLVTLPLLATCWILNSNERTERFARILLARRGNARCLQTSEQLDNQAATARQRPHTRRPRRPAAVRAPSR